MWAALPSGSQMASTSSGMAGSASQMFEDGSARYSAKAPGRVAPTLIVLTQRWRRPARQLRQWPQTMWPSPLTSSPTCRPRTSLPRVSITPTNSWPMISGTGTVRRAHSSHW